MTDGWAKVDKDERVHELSIVRAEKLGHVLGLIDTVMLAEEHPTIFNMTDLLRKLRQARKDYDVACAAYLDERLAT